MNFEFIKTRTFQTVALVVILLAIVFGIIIQLFVDNIPKINFQTDVSSNEFTVIDVIDGDTIEVEKGSEKFKVRYIGVDTPETVKPNTPAQCFGKEASNFNKDLVLNKKVRLESDVRDTDSFGRKLRYIYLLEGNYKDQMVNEVLVKNGYAVVLTVPPDVKFSKTFQEDEKRARDNDLGLWKECKS